MFNFFTDKRWWHWSILGTATIVFGIWFQVYLDSRINLWARDFYDTLQKAVSDPGSVTSGELYSFLLRFGAIAGIWILTAVLRDFLTAHWTFRWRQSMTEVFHEHYASMADVEGCSQRVQEDTLKFARLMESLGAGLIHSVMTILVFLPMLATLSKQVVIYPLVGEIPDGLVWLAFLAAFLGTGFLMWMGRHLPGIEFDIQREEAAYRKHLVLFEGDVEIDKEKMDFANQVKLLFDRVRSIHFTAYLAYAWFGVWKWSYLQFMVIVPYIALTPSIVAGMLTFGMIRQITDAFQKVESSLQYIIRSWGSIVELISVWKRLKAFNQVLKNRNK
ncbi:MAG: transporter [Gammaproteobacteria bacterium]|nr:MAG: transporter [Gammaproteobacteria bacterium]